MPILKQLVSSSVHSKRRSRADLTAEMISAPLGDFRHTMHQLPLQLHLGRPGGAQPCLPGARQGPGCCLETAGQGVLLHG
ncbi:CDC42EP4 isoform 4 [Pongo abelii]|uniref:CDC42EP4 isoform 3 n=1 Tax=Pongo abelii TaxID=9601 RepID=A0A2J8XZY6_PONAB|nr:CDC42EP4 isoform 3 [Pongo abelii]PNJ87594.1 CDC42EP4 isoform 4 [Pongo abelii]